MQIFERVFAPLNESEIKSFLDMLAEFNITSSHVKEGAFGAEQQTRIFNYVLRSIDVVRKMNEAYLTLIEKGLYFVETQSGTHPLLFSLNELKDKDCLSPIFVKRSNADRIVEQLSRQPSISVDLEDTQFIESYFSVAYREFMATLARLVIQTPMEAKKTGIRLEIENSQGSKVSIRITKM
jgi:hypothetical protein